MGNGHRLAIIAASLLLLVPVGDQVSTLFANLAAHQAPPQGQQLVIPVRDTVAARELEALTTTFGQEIAAIAARLRLPLTVPLVRDTVRDTVWLPSTIPSGTAARDAALVRQLDISIHRDSIRCRSLTTSALQGRCNRAVARITAVRDSLRPSMPVPTPDPVPDPTPTVTLSLTAVRDTVWSRSTANGLHFTLLRARVFRAGVEVSDAGVTWHTSDTTAANYYRWDRGTYQEFEVEDPRASTTITVTARFEGASASHALVLRRLSPAPEPVPTPTPPDTLPPVVVPPPSSGGIAELPRVWLNFPWPTSTRTVNVPAGANLQTALNNAQRGDELVLAAGATWTGNFTLPAKPGSGWITVRSSALSQLPAIGTRVGPAHASLMPKIVAPNSDPAIRTAAAATGWRLAGLEVTVPPALDGTHWGLIWLGTVDQTSLAAVPSDLVLDRVYVHGQITTQLRRCIALNSARTQVSDSYISECHETGFDSQAIAGQNGPGPYRIVNSYLAGAGENLFFGGGDPRIPGLVPSDIEIRGNYVHTPASWRGVWSKKNLFELKNAARVLVEGNVFDGSWQDAQVGEAVVVKSVNQDGGCRWCRTTDVTFRRNLLRNAGGGISIAGRPEQHPVDTAARRIVVSENVLDIGAVPGSRRAIILLAQASGVVVERNVISGQVAGVYTEAGAPCTFRDNVFARGEYGVIASGAGVGAAAVAMGCGSSYTWAGMTFVGTPNGTYPPGTSWVSTESQAPLAAQIRAIVQQATAGVVPP